MLKCRFHDARQNVVEVFEDQDAVHVVVLDSEGEKVSEIRIDEAGEASTWAKRKARHKVWDER